MAEYTPDPADREHRRKGIQEAVTMLACPYYQRKGACVSGCYQEPACIVDTPGADGWIGVLIQAEREEPGSVRAAIEETDDA